MKTIKESTTAHYGVELQNFTKHPARRQIIRSKILQMLMADNQMIAHNGNSLP
jgi:hypothetical protein